MPRDTLRLTALKILKTHRWRLLLLALFPLSVGLKMQGGVQVPYIGWPRLLGYVVLAPGLYFSTFLVVNLLQNATDAKQEGAGNVTFPGAIKYELLLAGVVILLTGVGTLMYRQGGHFGEGDIIFCVVMGSMIFYGWPRTIKFSDGALLQRNLFGVMKSIPYADVAGARYDVRQQCIIVSSSEGVRIIHSMFHARRKEFASQFTHFTGVRVENLSPDLEAPPA